MSTSSSQLLLAPSQHRRLNALLAQLDIQRMNVQNAGDQNATTGVTAAACSSTTAAASSSSPAASSSSTDGVDESGASPQIDPFHSSRQIPLFQQGNPKLQNAQKTDIRIDDIVFHRIPRIHDHLPNMPAYPNKFVRTKAQHQATRNAISPSMGNPQASHAAPTMLGTQSLNLGAVARSGLDVVSTTLTVDQPGYNQLIKDGDVVLLDIVRRSGLGPGGAKSFVRAGPREEICWAPGEAVAAIVTCGGLCPGLNDVIAELFNTLYYNYGVNRIHGIRCGYRGFWDPKFYPWLDLTPENVRGIDTLGGTVLGSSRGGFNLEGIMQACLNRGVNQLYIIGGDGTHRAADAIQHEARRRKIKMTVACVPKTIDNDIGVIDRSFGFNTAVAEARKAIQSAVVEASCAPNGLGIVQLMGRHAGYISAHAALASRQVDLVLIPEIPMIMDGPLGVLELTESILKRQGYGVIVVAEGAGMDIVPTAGVDESGNKKLPEIGKFLAEEIEKHFKRKKIDVSIKRHDPTYMIRSVPADAADSIYCMTLAQNAVHGSFAGFTGFTSGLVNNRTVMIPIPVITATSPSYLNPEGRTWERVLSLTHQPSKAWDLIAAERKKQKEAAGGAKSGSAR